MNVRHAKRDELTTILSIYEQARTYMREQGNPTQWSGGYPDEAILKDDISKNQLYVCEEEGVILGVFCYFFGNDPTYLRIFDGNWLNDAPYGVLHRIAVSAHRKGVASFCFDFCFSKCQNLKIDTHRDNVPMQKSLVKNGFSYCGIIHVEDGTPRFAYDRIS